MYAVLTKCDGVKVHILLGTFPDSYKMVISNIASQSEAPSYQSITVQLRDLISNPEKTSKSSVTLTPTAFATEASTSEPVCGYCKKKKGWSGRGHLETECRTKKREMAATQHQIHLANIENDHCCEWAFTADTTRQSLSRHWQYDSGCSVHITPYLSLLDNIIPHKVKVNGISGSEWSTHQGSATIT
jgi:hypothetical protein